MALHYTVLRSQCVVFLACHGAGMVPRAAATPYAVHADVAQDTATVKSAQVVRPKLWQDVATRPWMTSAQDSATKAEWLELVAQKGDTQRMKLYDPVERAFIPLPDAGRVRYHMEGQAGSDSLYTHPTWLAQVPSVKLHLGDRYQPVGVVFANALKGAEGNINFQEELMGKALVQELNLRSQTAALTTDVGLSPGNIAYAVPENMNVGQTYAVEVRIIKGGSDTLLLVGVDGAGYVVEALRIGDIAEAHLVDPSGGNDFIITLTAAKELGVDESVPATWEWGVRPLHGGKMSLVLSVSTRPLEGATKNIKVFERTVQVKAGFWYVVLGFLKSNWQWLWTLIVAPVILYFRKRIGECFKKRPTPAPAKPMQQ